MRNRVLLYPLETQREGRRREAVAVGGGGGVGGGGSRRHCSSSPEDAGHSFPCLTNSARNADAHQADFVSAAHQHPAQM